ncbi:MAG: 23S rRNA (adenine(2503)-C(2))-methyltransferase RlmN [Syntrophomonadaceae bacterium]|nr:23S rRNA (adenine(2503)-C(2))-methyltransferase RlmN [Syntrophomonadaceae bacterium]
MAKTEILGLSFEEIESVIVGLGLPRYRANQIYHWLYKRQTHSFFGMGNIPKELRETLNAQLSISLPKMIKARISKDGTRKFLLELPEKKRIEVVAIPQHRHKDRRYTICLSSQVGCPLRCAFCATGQSGFERDLTAGEIVGQLVVAEREIRKREKIAHSEKVLSNVVFMGMGEPLLNLDAVLKAIEIINDERGIGIGQRHITISTAGIIPGIEMLAASKLQVTLAISLHAATDEQRSSLIPVNRRFSLEPLMEAVNDYIRKTGRRVTFEYVLIKGINDSAADAVRLAKMVNSLLANLNLIPYNPTDVCEFQRPDQETINSFYALLKNKGVNVTFREEMGADIEAACGQLKGRLARYKQENDIIRPK